MRLLVATDFSIESERAIELVRQLPLPVGSEIRLVNAVEPITAIWGFVPADMLTLTDEAESASRAECAKVAKRFARPGIDVSITVSAGRAADVVIETATTFDPDLIIVGSRGRGAVATSLLGSVSAEVVDRAECPVLVARRETLARLVLADDGSPFSAVGAGVLARLPIFRDVAVHVVSVVDLPFPVISVDPTATAAAITTSRAYEEDRPRARAERQAIARTRRSALAALGLRTTSEVREGDADVELIAAARAQDADCIVVGGRGQTGLKRVLIGSTARAVLFGAPCSVLIAHPSSRIPSADKAKTEALATSA